MRAVCWEGKERITVETVPDPQASSCFVRVASTRHCPTANPTRD